MQFIKVAAIATLAVGSHAAVTAEQAVSNLESFTTMSTEADNVAKSISLVNFFSTTPQVINKYRDLIQALTNDMTSMDNKAKRQECLDVEDLEKCIADLEEIIEDPSEILGDKKKRDDFVGSGAARAVVARQAAPQYDEAQQEAICAAYRSFTQAQGQALSTLIGKHGILSLTPFTPPIAAVLRVVEGATDNYSFDLIEKVPTCAQSTTQSKNTFDNTIDQAIQQYS